MLSVRAPVGDLNIASCDCSIGRGLASIRSRNATQNHYIFYLIKSLSDVWASSNDEGTIFGSINKDAIANIGIVIPPINEMERFNRQIDKLESILVGGEREIHTLTEMKSLALSKIGQS